MTNCNQIEKTKIFKILIFNMLNMTKHIRQQKKQQETHPIGIISTFTAKMKTESDLYLIYRNLYQSKLSNNIIGMKRNIFKSLVSLFRETTKAQNSEASQDTYWQLLQNGNTFQWAISDFTNACEGKQGC